MRPGDQGPARRAGRAARAGGRRPGPVPAGSRGHRRQGVAGRAPPPPGTLIAPLHRHTREVEFSLVLDGRMGVCDGEEVEAGAGDLVWKPRNAWHTSWNAGDAPVCILEVITPGGLEELFRSIDALDAFPEPDELERMAAPFGLDLDLAGTTAVLDRHGLRL